MWLGVVCRGKCGVVSFDGVAWPGVMYLHVAWCTVSWCDGVCRGVAWLCERTTSCIMEAVRVALDFRVWERSSGEGRNIGKG